MFTLIDLMSKIDQQANMARAAEHGYLGLLARPAKRMPKAPKQTKQTESKPEFQQTTMPTPCCEGAAA